MFFVGVSHNCINELWCMCRIAILQRCLEYKNLYEEMHFCALSQGIQCVLDWRTLMLKSSQIVGFKAILGV